MKKIPYSKYNLSNLDETSYKKFDVSSRQFIKMVIDYRDKTGIGIYESKKILLKTFSIIKSLNELNDVSLDIGKDYSNCSNRYRYE